MFLFYEDICQNPLEIVQKIASFIGINDLTPEVYLYPID